MQKATATITTTYSNNPTKLIQPLWTASLIPVTVESTKKLNKTKTTTTYIHIIQCCACHYLSCMLYTLCTIMYVQRVSCKRSGEYTWKKKLSFFNVRAVNVRWIELTLSSAFVVPIFFGCIICCFSIYFSISFFHPKLLQMIDSFARSFIPSFA